MRRFCGWKKIRQALCVSETEYTQCGCRPRPEPGKDGPGVTGQSKAAGRRRVGWSVPGPNNSGGGSARPLRSRITVGGSGGVAARAAQAMAYKTAHWQNSGNTP